MSVVVIGIAMPEDCIVCYDTTRCFGTGRYFEDGTIWCGLAKGYIGLKDTSEKCPLVELPVGHGRLVDAESLDMERLYRFSSSGDGSLESVYTKDEYPTVLEGEE